MTNWQAWMACGLLMSLPAAAQADIFRWDNGQLIPGTEGITPGPGVDLSAQLVSGVARNVTSGFADFSGGLDLTEANFSSSWLDNARFNGANLTAQFDECDSHECRPCWSDRYRSQICIARPALPASSSTPPRATSRGICGALN